MRNVGPDHMRNGDRHLGTKPFCGNCSGTASTPGSCAMPGAGLATQRRSLQRSTRRPQRSAQEDVLHRRL